LLVDARFADVSVETVTRELQLPEGALFARMNAMAAIGMSAAGKAMSDAEKAEVGGRIANESLEVVSGYTKDGLLTFALATNVAIASA
jgi:hypothetical protein